ncbi:uncharacterized protein LOC100899640 [Galendromus occidentalis]|uniref:Uncharacterized protein LOC100899640 n=1 Tax=Galendromus occidentalis TaxID=34638 RepID=A0AAJ6QR32_9ACAR|nr:uncharacterized protein LOC100899640 [Galendromus occidentalis]
MAGRWTPVSDDSDTETGEDSSVENLIEIQAPQYMLDDLVVNPPRVEEVIVVSSDDEETSSDSSLPTSYTSSSSPLTSDPSSSPFFDFNDQSFTPRFLFRDPEFLQANHPVIPSMEGIRPHIPEYNTDDTSQETLGSPDVGLIQEAIQRKLPLVEDLTPVLVSLDSNRKILANFPGASEVCSKSPGAKGNNDGSLQKQESSGSKKMSKYDPESPTVSALKRYQISTISEAIWRPGTRRAEVTQRRGKQMETIGSAGNPTFLEFYEALFLMTRVKLRLLLPDLTPMSVFEACNILARDPEDYEVYLIYEYLMNCGAIVAPFRPPKRTLAADGSQSAKPKSSTQIPPAHSAPPPPKTSAFSAYKKDDSDSDLEVLSCSMPEVALTYEQNVPYEGPEITFPALGVSMKNAALPAIPRELLPECKTVSSEYAQNGRLNERIPLFVNNISLYPQWFTPEGMEDKEPVPEDKAPVKRGRKRKAAPRISQKKKKLKVSPQNDGATHPGCMPQANDEIRERYNRRWFPRWFDGIELGVHSTSIVDTLHKFTADGIPKIQTAESWSEYKNVFAKLVKESQNNEEDHGLYKGTTTPLMTGTKKNQTQLIFEELQLTQEISESFDLRKRIEEMNEHGRNIADHSVNSCIGDGEAVSRSANSPKIIFDVYIDSAYSKTKPCTPDYRVVKLKAESVLNISDLIKLSLEAGDATLLIAHVADCKVRVRQAMTFSIPRYN